MEHKTQLNNLPFFYLLSMGRSGSTLLEFILDAHPNVNIPMESRFIIHLYYHYASKTNWTETDKQNFIRDLNKDYKFSKYWNVDRKKLEEAILNTPSHVSFFELCRIVTAHYISFYPKKEMLIQGSKNPIYSYWCDILYDLHPNAKFIHLVRNPMGVVASRKKLGGKNTAYFAYRWNFVNRKIERIKQKAPGNFITVNYEDLLNSPEQTVQKICSFLNLDYHPEQLQFNEPIRELKEKIDPVAEKEKMEMFNSYLKNLVNPIDNSTANSWQKTLTEQEKKDISYITQEVAAGYGYTHNEKGAYRLKFILAKLRLKYRLTRHRMYYQFSLSLRK